MRRLIFIAIGALEFSVVAVLLRLAYEIPGSAEINQGFQSAGQVTEKAGAQVRLLRDQVKTLQRMELHQVSARLQKQAEIITSTLRSQTVDFETVGSMRDAVADLGKGLGDLAESDVAEMRHGVVGRANDTQADLQVSANGQRATRPRVEDKPKVHLAAGNGRLDVFGHGEGQHMAESFRVPFLGEIEIDPQIRIGGDTGKPVASLGEDAPGGKSIFNVARRLVERLDQVNAAAAGPVVQIL